MRFSEKDISRFFLSLFILLDFEGLCEWGNREGGYREWEREGGFKGESEGGCGVVVLFGRKFKLFSSKGNLRSNEEFCGEIKEK